LEDKVGKFTMQQHRTVLAEQAGQLLRGYQDLFNNVAARHARDGEQVDYR
jgi:hypothetical protein